MRNKQTPNPNYPTVPMFFGNQELTPIRRTMGQRPYVQSDRAKYPAKRLLFATTSRSFRARSRTPRAVKGPYIFESRPRGFAPGSAGPGRLHHEWPPCDHDHGAIAEQRLHGGHPLMPRAADVANFREGTVAESVRVGPWQVVRELRGGFVFRPAAITLALAALALGLCWLEERVTAAKAWNDFLDRLFPPEPEAAHIVLGTIAGSMITVVSVVYSIPLVVLTFALRPSSRPRVLVAFVEDRVSQTTLGVFIGTFTYCLLTLPGRSRSQLKPFVPSVAVIVAIVLAISCLACLLYFIHHIALSIQASHVVDRVARETERILDDVLPSPHAELPADASPEPIPRGEPVLAVVSGYIRAIDEASLLGVKAGPQRRAPGRSVDRAVRRGGYAAPGGLAPVARRLSSEPPADAPSMPAPPGPWSGTSSWVSFQIGISPLKAISPAVNDPTTARLDMRADQGQTHPGPRGVARAAERDAPRPRGNSLRRAPAHLVPSPARRRVQPDSPLRQGGRGCPTPGDARPQRTGSDDAEHPLRRCGS